MVQGFRLVLASGSPRRRELLAQAGYVFEVQAADVDESLRVDEAADAYVRRLAEEKAQAVFERYALPTHHRDEAAMNGAREISGSMGEGPLVVPWCAMRRSWQSPRMQRMRCACCGGCPGERIS